jgi:hypothetical protein
VTTQGVGQGGYAEFKRQLTADKYGLPAAICDLLFAQYVAGKSDRGRSSSGGELDDRPVKRRLVRGLRGGCTGALCWELCAGSSALGLCAAALRWGSPLGLS